MPESLTPALVIEIVATSANLLFIVLLIREKILCWSFGIIGSALSVYLFLDAKLYSEALLYAFYALMGLWGWLRWHRREAQSDNPVIRWASALHLRAIALCVLAALGVGYFVSNFSDAQRPWIDAFTTVFSFLATYLEINKVLEAWVYWIALNLASIWLYHDRQLDIYAALIAIYALMSVWGLRSWWLSFQRQVADQT